MNEEAFILKMNPEYKSKQYSTYDLDRIIKNNSSTLFSVLTKYKNLPLHFCVKHFLHPNYDYINEGLDSPISIYDVLRHQPHLKAKDIISCYYNIFGGPISRL